MMNDNDLGNFKSAYSHLRVEIEALMETDDPEQRRRHWHEIKRRMATLEELCPAAPKTLS